jgi:hypothetical protein
MAEPTRLTIRMYQVGFGDCFLVTFHYRPEDGSDRHILIDFGSKAAPKGVSRAKRMTDIANAIREVCRSEEHPDGKLLAVVATHRHEDHISGFATNGHETPTGKIIAAMNPEVVIQPWTEDPKAATTATGPTRVPDGSKAFLGMLKNMQAFSKALVEQVRRLQHARIDQNLSKSRRLSRLEFAGENNLSNLSAVKNLQKMGKRRRASYVYHGSRSGLEGLLPGVTVHVLGPPTLKQSSAISHERRRDDEEFWHFMALGAGRFDSHVGVGGEAAVGAPLFGGQVVPSAQYPPHTRWFTPRVDSLNVSQMLELVRIIDDALNNTSVILLFEIQGQSFLFPGDAQIENWDYALNDNPDDEQRNKLAELLAAVRFYKVGHHASLNATPKSLWKLFRYRGARRRRRLATAVSTLEGKYGSKDEGTEVPRQKLMKELRESSDCCSTQDLRNTIVKTWEYRFMGQGRWAALRVSSDGPGPEGRRSPRQRSTE